MINRFQTRVQVTQGIGAKKKTVFERILPHEESATLDFNTVFNGLRQLFSDGTDITLSVNGI